MATVIAAKQALQPALDMLRQGGVVAVPTETVYGLAGDATNGEAVARIFEAKGRPRFNPLIAHVSDPAMADKHVRIDPVSRKLAEAFWPGPLTLVLPLRAQGGAHPLVTAGLETLAVRMPRGFAGDLIAALDRPLAAPSANSSGRISPTTAAHVLADLGRRIPLIVDDGSTEVGLESTILKVENGRIRLLRPGGVDARAIEAVAGSALDRGGGAGIEAPGMMASHYAPNARLRLNVAELEPDEALLGFGPQRADVFEYAAAFRNLSAVGDLREAAANLFAHLQALDAAGVARIAVEPVPQEGLGEAINDRLRRAAAPRDSARAGT